ncbi:unnamed protein product [Closterium sp. Yama58-4]|nr:unnamed protein product [Closterium sp. Yama58-4]
MNTSSTFERCSPGHSLFTNPTDGVRKREESFSNLLSSSSELLSGAANSGSPPPYIPAKVNAISSPNTEKSSGLNEWEAPPYSSPQKIIEELFSDLPAKPLECGGCMNADLGAHRSVPCGEWGSLNSTAPLVVSLLFFDDERSQLYVSIDLQLPSKKRDWAANGMYFSSIEDLSIIGVVVHQIGQPKLRVILLPGVQFDVLPTTNVTHEEFREAIRAALVSADAIIYSVLNIINKVFFAIQATSLNICNDVHAALVARANGLLRDAFRVNMRLLPVLAQMEIAGVRVDMDLLMSKRDYLEKRMEHLTSIGEKLVGRRVNLASPKQVAQALDEDLKLPVGAAKSVGMAKKREAQTHSTTNEATLSQLAALHQFPNIVLEFRQLLKVKSTWIDGLLSSSYSETVFPSLLHVMRLEQVTQFCCVLRMVVLGFTRSGMLLTRQQDDCHLPALIYRFDSHITSNTDCLFHELTLLLEQNLPTYALEGTSAATNTLTVAIAIRDALMSAPGKVLVSADYSQIELRIFAHLSADEALVNVFKAGQQSDVFRLIGAAYLGKSADAVNDQERQLVKRLCYGILYGQGKQAMAAILGVDVDKAQQLLQSFLDHFPSYFQIFMSVIQRGEPKQKGRQ